MHPLPEVHQRATELVLLLCWINSRNSKSQTSHLFLENLTTDNVIYDRRQKQYTRAIEVSGKGLP